MGLPIDILYTPQPICMHSGSYIPAHRNATTMKQLVLSLSLLAGAAAAQAQCYTIMTYAGSDSGYAGDGGSAMLAKLSLPTGVAADHSGNLYVADYGACVIRKVTAGGLIYTVAGTGTPGFGGDGGPATAAPLKGATGVATDAAGNLYIADEYNNRVRKVTTAGTITTLAGTDSSGFAGDDGPATAALLSFPSGIAVDAIGDIYIADQGNDRIRMIDTSGTMHTVAGTGVPGWTGDSGPATAAGLFNPTGVALDAAGNLYIADYSNNVVRMVNTSGTISTVAGNNIYGFSGDGGAATAAQLYNPSSVAADVFGNLFIADESNNRVRIVSPAGIIRTFAGDSVAGYSGDGGSALLGRLNRPTGVTTDNFGKLFIADFHNHVVRMVYACEGVPQIGYGSQGIYIKPNPTSGLLMVQSSTTVNRLRLTNAVGSTVFEAAPTGNPFQLDLGTLPAGIYFLEVRTADGTQIEKVVRE